VCFFFVFFRLIKSQQNSCRLSKKNIPKSISEISSEHASKMKEEEEEEL